MKEFKTIYKDVYGKVLFYPENDTAKTIAKLMKVKTFRLEQLRDINELGAFTVVTKPHHGIIDYLPQFVTI